MSDPFAAAAPLIFRAFADRERIVYTQAGVALPAPIAAVRRDDAAPDPYGAGRTARRVEYEIQIADLPAAPTKADSFTHRGRRWAVEDRTRLDAVGAWLVFVIDAGPAS
ncbi:hypothetical protein COA17_11070 [Sphingomonas ginsenosidimutans]|jgi:hypothetical protein|uniref:Head-tail adaptor protein n=1 Tax=Sphingomonas ginsenosidimutans TaxID=862134 RepID=A0A2A4HWE9_9SPHN|nr:hypothetical protein [Sphingomonas ginsenosidimutans]PCG08690.1 hypothetical protein COA17_11070 [Sphingomonas ginsenosidimutans]